jgi:hypothetical protein
LLKQKSNTMKIELKNVKFSEFASEETNCFAADLYVDGKKVGYCKNDGHGGNTWVHNLDMNTVNKFREVEEYCKTLPGIKFGGALFPSNLENVVDKLFEEWLEEKNKKRMQKKLEKSMLKGICIEEDNGFTLATFKMGGKVIPLAHCFRVEPVLEHIKEFCITEKKKGKKILNTNLPFTI